MKSYRTIIMSAIGALLFTVTACSSDSDSEPTPPPTPTPTPTPSQPDYSGKLVEVEVIGYNPTPGQFINEIPEYETGDTQATINTKAEEALNAGDMVSLGAFGGSITLRLKQPIENKADARDFRVRGNAYYTSDEDATPLLGNSEPGIIAVSRDDNGNGEADDAWYIIEGSENATLYTLTYELLHIDGSTPDYEIGWWDEKGNSGKMPILSEFHSQSYYPQWLSNSCMTVTAYRLPDNGYFNNETGNYEQYSYEYGYADCHPNDTEASCIDIDWAVNEAGKKVNLSRIDFIRIHTGVFQFNGGLGECSTEVAGIETLHK